MLTRMAELMFVEVVRRHVASLSPARANGMARGARRLRSSGRRSARCTRGPSTRGRCRLSRRDRSRAPCSSSGSRRSSAFRRCNISRSGGCSSQPTSSRADRRKWRRSAREWATNPRQRSVAPSSARPARARPPGAAPPGVALRASGLRRRRTLRACAFLPVSSL